MIRFKKKNVGFQSIGSSQRFPRSFGRFRSECRVRESIPFTRTTRASSVATRTLDNETLITKLSVGVGGGAWDSSPHLTARTAGQETNATTVGVGLMRIYGRQTGPFWTERDLHLTDRCQLVPGQEPIGWATKNEGTVDGKGTL